MNTRTWMITSITICRLAFSSPGPAIGQATNTVISLDGSDWRLAIDPQNAGREQKWFETPRPEAKPTKVPWIIQDAFPGYHGVAWYWRNFTAPLTLSRTGGICSAFGTWIIWPTFG